MLAIIITLIIECVMCSRKFGMFTVKTHLKWHATITGTWFRRAMSQYSGTHLLNCLVQHAILSEAGPIRAHALIPETTPDHL